jgi:hypothetical protein
VSRAVSRHRFATAPALLLVFFATLFTPAHAQSPSTPSLPPTASTASASSTAAQDIDADDDDSKLRPLEPDFSTVNLPTTLPLPVHKGNFHLTHRFDRNLRNDSFGTQLSTLFGLDEGATIQLEYRFGVMKHLEAIVSRTNVERIMQFAAKYDAFHQSASRPVGLSALASVEGADNFRERHAPALGVVVSRTLGNLAAVYATPVWAHNTLPVPGITQNTFYVGLGARVRVRPSLFAVGEVSPRVSGYAPGDAAYAFAVEKRVGAHVFSLTFANSAATTYGQLARGGNPGGLYLGFNLARKFF